MGSEDAGCVGEVRAAALSAGAGDAAVTPDVLAVAAVNEHGSLSGVPSPPKLAPSLRHVVNVLQRFGSGHRSSGV